MHGIKNKLNGYVITNIRHMSFCPVSFVPTTHGIPPSILKWDGMYTSGRRLISLNIKTMRIAYFLEKKK